MFRYNLFFFYFPDCISLCYRHETALIPPHLDTAPPSQRSDVSSYSLHPNSANSFLSQEITLAFSHPDTVSFSHCPDTI
ncbi:hypothetical protein BDZ91DRAFT_711697 [Kalaharituber pfeilii]|nr:hypothetical protein BDZ91DRAFT_711697 [Kalaharituber pfeilii]